MNVNNIETIVVNNPNDLPEGKSDWNKVDALTNDDIYQKALSDPDAQPLDERKPVETFLNVKLIRAKLGMTQERFATTFHLSLATLKDWEQKRVKPDQAARTLLEVIKRNPNAVQNALKSA